MNASLRLLKSKTLFICNRRKLFTRTGIDGRLLRYDHESSLGTSVFNIYLHIESDRLSRRESIERFGLVVDEVIGSGNNSTSYVYKSANSLFRAMFNSNRN